MADGRSPAALAMFVGMKGIHPMRVANFLAKEGFQIFRCQLFEKLVQARRQHRSEKPRDGGTGFQARAGEKENRLNSIHAPDGPADG